MSLEKIRAQNFIFLFLFLVLIYEIRRQGESKIPFRNFTGRKFLLKFSNLVQKMKIVSLIWNLVPKLIKVST